MTIARDQLRSYVERIERVETEVRDLNADKSDLYKEAKSNGFDVPTLKRVIARRRKDPAEMQEADALFDLYMHALGMIPDDTVPSRVHAHEARTPAGADTGRTVEVGPIQSQAKALDDAELRGAQRASVAQAEDEGAGRASGGAGAAAPIEMPAVFEPWHCPPIPTILDRTGGRR